MDYTAQVVEAMNFCGRLLLVVVPPLVAWDLFSFTVSVAEKPTGEEVDHDV